jgi:hypothetical protein
MWKAGAVVWTSHAEARMKTRKIEMTDIQHLVRYGRVTEHSRPRFKWRYKIEGTSVDGESLRCLVEINGHLVIVTVLW